MRRALLMSGVVLAALGLTGCVPTGFSDLEREATDADAVPAGLPDYALEGFDVDTLRLVGEVDGQQLYLAKGINYPICLLIYPGPEDWNTTCGSEMTATTIGSFEVQVVSDPFPSKDGWTSVGQNIRVRDR